MKRLKPVMELITNLVCFAKSTEKCFKELAAHQHTLKIQNEALTQRVGALEKRLAAMNGERNGLGHGAGWSNTH